jgi:hypothetical protein
MADPRVHERRSSRSRSPIRPFTMADLRVHVAPIWAFTIGRRTQSTGRAPAPPRDPSPAGEDGSKGDGDAQCLLRSRRLGFVTSC